KAKHAGQIEEHDGVAGRQTEVEGPAVVAVDDPPFTGHEPPNGLAPFFARRRLPSGPPIEEVEVDEREARPPGETLGDRGLPRPTRADYQHALHRDSRGPPESRAEKRGSQRRTRVRKARYCWPNKRASAGSPYNTTNACGTR